MMFINSDKSFCLAEEGNVRYIVFEDGAQSPNVLTDDDFSAIYSSKAIFARKFDEKIDTGIIERICEGILKSGSR